MALEGVRVGPLDPDRGEMFGQVGGQMSARQLVRHHMALNPPALVAALSGKPHPERSEALDREEVSAAVIEYYADTASPLPDGAVITGANVRGVDDTPDRQFVTVTWHVPTDAGGSGRSGKAFIPYNSDTVPNSKSLGDEAVRIEKLKKAGLPWHPSQLAHALAGTSVVGAQDPDEALVEERDGLAAEAETLRKQLADSEAARVAAETQAEEAAAALAAAQTPAAPADDSSGAAEAGATDDASSDAEPSEPWDGYDSQNADKIRKRLREKKDVPEAEAVVAYESKHANRGTVVAAANEVLDRTPSQ
jgi:hypothetical protein